MITLKKDFAVTSLEWIFNNTTLDLYSFLNIKYTVNV